MKLLITPIHSVTSCRVVSGRSSVILKKNRSAVTVALIVGGRTPVSVRCS